MWTRFWTGMPRLGRPQRKLTTFLIHATKYVAAD